jgi:predicted amidohydrolase YtcJ
MATSEFSYRYLKLRETMGLRFLVVLVGFASTMPLWCQSPTPSADLVIRNARVWTVDSSRPEAEAVAVLGDRIVAVGSTQEVDTWRGSKTQIVDAGGKRLLPGFHDAHVHFTEGGAQLDSVQLNDATSPQEFTRILERAAKRQKGEWILNGNWDETKWSSAQLPTKELIDPLTSDTRRSKSL